mmetsp:Transcript_27558/g.38873  ORF Transcript_27558/g.38873 Transcript_27558/m.38873 type:complete len:182 (+) Transcript_27558:16-561(+)
MNDNNNKQEKQSIERGEYKHDTPVLLYKHNAKVFDEVFCGNKIPSTDEVYWLNRDSPIINEMKYDCFNWALGYRYPKYLNPNRETYVSILREHGYVPMTDEEMDNHKGLAKICMFYDIVGEPVHAQVKLDIHLESGKTLPLWTSKMGKSEYLLAYPLASIFAYYEKAEYPAYSYWWYKANI